MKYQVTRLLPYFFLPLLVSILLTSCEDPVQSDSSSTKSNVDKDTNTIVVLDTVYINKSDTLVKTQKDTVYLNKSDTLVITQKDTTYLSSSDTVIAIVYDTIYIDTGNAIQDTIQDTIHIIDTVNITMPVPTIDSVTVISSETAVIQLRGTFSDSDNLKGFVLFSSFPDKEENPFTSAKAILVDTLASGSGTVGILLKEFEVSIDDIDKDQAWYVAAFNINGTISQAVEAHYYGRKSNENELRLYNRRDTYNSQIAAGLDIDMERVTLKEVESGIHLLEENRYASKFGADVVVERTTSGGVGITPIGGAVLFKVSSETQLSDVDVDQIYTSSYADEITQVNGFVVYANGKSIRQSDGIRLYDLMPGDEFFVISNSFDVARLIVKEVSNMTVTFSCRKDSGKNSGLKIRAD